MQYAYDYEQQKWVVGKETEQLLKRYQTEYGLLTAEQRAFIDRMFYMSLPVHNVVIGVASTCTEDEETEEEEDGI